MIYKFELDKLNLNEDDILIMKLPTDECGELMCDCDEASAYFQALKKQCECRIIALPSNYQLEVGNIETLEIYRDHLQEQIDLLKGEIR